MEKNNTGKHAGAEQPQQPSFFKEMGEFIRPYSGRYGVSVVFSVLGVLANLASYVFVGLIIGLIFSENAVLRDFILFGGLAVGAKILNALLINFSTWISHRAAYLTLHDIRMAVVQKLKGFLLVILSLMAAAVLILFLLIESRGWKLLLPMCCRSLPVIFFLLLL